MNNLTQLIITQKTVFSFQELKEILQISSDDGVKSFLKRAKKNQTLSNPHKGFRALPNYDYRELACKIRTEAYISCETVLFKEGVFFQFYGNTVSCMASRSAHQKINEKNLIFYKLKPELLANPKGIKIYDTYRVATPERALCDYIYLNPRGVIDAPESINKIRLEQILPLYPQKTALYIEKLLNVEY
ncbi:MAG: hypothetical protein LBU27_05930 [Candidatus Peribacteria bacterium]|jgi:hypothetical protein|nr:hypothetical protein [Candidatus Peribacteria bacterium]